ncbi:Os09g0516250 [Oryza sativa Japonica Group]|uniref:Os09g0516250 protein n=1 Tax=Oryza sativa subsp. japonica TaxID=39947 RepID=A0A0P0XP92_ORYSJ|nr:Os09g0516250 [Oryza sativa Japonica Group]
MDRLCWCFGLAPWAAAAAAAATAAAAPADDDSASASDDAPHVLFSFSTSRNMEKSSSSFSSDSDGPSPPPAAHRSRSSGRLRISEWARLWPGFLVGKSGMRLMSYSAAAAAAGGPARRVACGGNPSPPSPGIGDFSLFIFSAPNARKSPPKTAPRFQEAKLYPPRFSSRLRCEMLSQNLGERRGIGVGNWAENSRAKRKI